MLFDFDGTLLKDDSLLLFLSFTKLSHTYVFFRILISLPFLVIRSFQVGMRQAIKEKVLFLSLEKQHRSAKELGECFANYLLEEGKWNPVVLKEFRKGLDNENTTVCLVSASPDLWIKPLAEHFGALYICTRCAYTSKGKFAGKFVGKNCNGAEKKNRLKERFVLASYERIIAYGNHPVQDAELFACADVAYLVKNDLIYCIKNGTRQVSDNM